MTDIIEEIKRKLKHYSDAWLWAGYDSENNTVIELVREDAEAGLITLKEYKVDVDLEELYKCLKEEGFNILFRSDEELEAELPKEEDIKKRIFKCPLRFNLPLDQQYCITKDCAWWDEDREKCAIMLLFYKLEDLLYPE